MLGTIILFACYGLIGWLLRQDLKWRDAGGRALWIPGIWLAIQGSRPLSYWFGGTGGSEANPIDTLAFGALIGLAVIVLFKARLKWLKFATANKTLLLIYVFFLCSAFWSESPPTSIKRLFKDFGCVLVGLVFLIQPDPAAAVRAVFVRVSYVLFPLSMVFIKFFPEIGRCSTRAGENMFTGITTHKNTLGLTVFVFGLFILWDLFETFRSEERAGKQMQVMIRLGLFLMGLWLLITCDSATALLCLMLGSFIFWGSGRLMRMRRGKRVLIACLATVICLAVLDQSFGISEAVAVALGRDPGLTGRTDIWQMVMDQETDPLLGNGFYTFWDSDKGKAIVDSYMRINSTHNGYLEMYVDGGFIGCVLLGLLLLVAGGRAINRTFDGFPLGRMGLIFWLLAILYNFSETSYFRPDVLWFTFLLTMIKYSVRTRVAGI